MGTVGEGPKLASRRENRKSAVRIGRTIGAERERLETRNERAAARKKDKRKFIARIVTVSIAFLVLIIILIVLATNFIGRGRESESLAPTTDAPITLAPSVEIVDEDASATGGELTSRMREYIALAEADFRDLDLKPIKAVLPTGTIREVDFYLDGYTGRIKMTIDRDSALSTEDAERMLRYLAGQDITDFEYIDVRIDGKAYWK